MVIVFFIILFVMLLTLVIVLSTIKIEIEKIYLSNINSKKIQYDYLIFLELQFLNKIKIMKLKINPKRIEKLNQKVNLKQKIQQTDFKKIRNDLPNKEELKNILKKLNIKLKEFHLKLELGTWDVIITSAIITILSSGLGIIIAKLIDIYNKEKYEYEIMPVYKNKNVVKLSLNCIIQVKVVHIISIIFTLVRKRKEKEKNERTSNRRSYDYSYEQY